MKGLLPKMFKHVPAVVKKTSQVLENDHAKVLIEAEQIHPDVVLFKGVAFAKKARFKDYGETLKENKPQTQKPLRGLSPARNPQSSFRGSPFQFSA